LAPEYPAAHEHPQLPAAKVPVADPPFYFITNEICIIIFIKIEISYETILIH